MGPVLSLRRAGRDRWRVSALIVAAKTDVPDVLVFRRRGSHSEDASEVTAKELWVHGGEAVYRYDMAVSRDAERAICVEYRFPGMEKSWTFHVPAAGQKPRMAFVSCNGFSSAAEMKKVKDKNRLWKQVAALHSGSPYHLLIMGGDRSTPIRSGKSVPR